MEKPQDSKVIIRVFNKFFSTGPEELVFLLVYLLNLKFITKKYTMKIFLQVSLIILVSLCFGESMQSQTAMEIVERMDSKMRGDAAEIEMTMTIVRPRYTRDVTMKSWSLGTDFSLILITAPAREKGTAFLKRENEIWNWVPRVERMVKLPPSMMSQSWMGSDFTNDDLIRESSVVTDYDHRILRTEEYGGRECYVIEMIPKPDAAVVYERVLVWVTKGDFIQLRVENYDEYGDLANHIALSEITQFRDREIPARLEMIPADQNDQKTVIQYHSANFDIEIEEDFFSVQNLKRMQ